MSQYILRFSVTAFVAWMLQLMPPLIRIINPPARDVWRRNYSKNKWINIARRIFQVLTVVLLLFAVNREKGDGVSLNSWLIVAVLLLVVSYAAWIQYLRGKASPFSLIFGIALVEPLYLIAAAQCLNNSLVIIPCLVFGVLQVGITVARFGPRG